MITDRSGLHSVLLPLLITSILKSLATLAIWLALSSTIFANCISTMTVVYFKPCPLAFFACTRVGELTLTTSKDRGSLIQLHQLTQLVDVDQRVIALKFTFLDFKHNYNQRPFSVVEIVETIFVLYKSSWTICLFVGAGQGLLFCVADGSPVSRYIFIYKLSMAIKYCGLDPSRYKGHSFRIGAASYAADAGTSDAQIRALGRWKSNAFQKYIRIPALSS